VVPRSRPQIKRIEAEQLLRGRGIASPVALLGVRGYYLDQMGEPGKNDRGIYDDAIVLVWPGGYQTFNANTDPRAHRAGIAVLAPGLWQYRLGTHGLSKPPAQQYRALVQAAPVTVIRDERGPDTGLFGINIHRGSYRSTSSLGCQTIYPSQWPEFIAAVERELKAARLTRIPYLLITEEERRT
jgi:hypothetical protein